MLSSWLRASVCVTTLLLVPRQTHASAFDVQGLGPDGVAEVGARSASAEDGSAAFFNPGGLALGNGTALLIAPIVSVSTLRAQDKRLPFEDPFGITLTASATIPFEGPLANRLRIGFSGHFLPTAALRLLARAPEEPFYPYYDNRTQRLVALPALGVRITKWLGIGFGANVLAGVRGPAKLEKGATGAPEPRIDIAANTVVSGIFGVRWDPTKYARFALVVRQGFGIPLNIDTTADIGGVPLATNLQAKMAMFDPLTVVLASSFDVGKVHIETSVSHAKWSDWESPYLSVQSTLPGVNLVSRIPSKLFRDTMSFRIGSNYSIATSARTKLVLRAGIAAEPTILAGNIQGRTNLVDGDKLTLGLGATFALKNARGNTLRIGLGGNGQFVSEFNQEKRPCQTAPCPETTVAGPDANSPSTGITNPGYPRLTASGALFTLSLGVGADF
ncbi:MAG: outer membrane protein transport protein [Polyangiaceae bacterium]|nr:outer membrane protein transport protein [Polyangiaceae bacterium]